MDNKDKNKKNPANDPNQGQGVNYEQTARLRIIKSEEIEADLKGKTIKNKLNKIKPMKTSSIYRKKYLVLALVVVLIFVLAYQLVKVKNLDFATLGANVEKKVSMENFVKGNDLSLRKLYGINKIEVEKYISYVPKSNMMANEILIVKAKPDTEEGGCPVKELQKLCTRPIQDNEL